MTHWEKTLEEAKSAAVVVTTIILLLCGAMIVGGVALAIALEAFDFIRAL